MRVYHVRTSRYAVWGQGLRVEGLGFRCLSLKFKAQVARHRASVGVNVTRASASRAASSNAACRSLVSNVWGCENSP